MKTTDNKFVALAQNYFGGILTPEEEKELFGLLESDKANRILLREIEKTWQTGHQSSPRENLALANIMTGIKGTPSKPIRSAKIWIYSLAGVCIALALALTFSLTCPPRTDNGFCICSDKTDASSMTLSDGTKVMLCHGSKFSCEQGFSPRNRKVSLSGDAYFDVTTDPKHPFEVSMGDCSIVVTGTKFSVSASDDIVQATLIEGAIDLHTCGEIHKILPGESVSYQRFDKTIKTRHIDKDEYLALMEGRIEYYNVTLSELAGRLEGLYGKNITLDSKLSSSDMTVSLRLSNRETFEEVVNALKVMAPMSIRCEGDKVWLTSLQ